MAEVGVVDEEVELVQEVTNVDAAEWVHLREGEYAGKRHIGDRAIWRVPTDVDHFLVLFGILDGHWHVVVRRDDFEEVVAIAAFEEFRIFVEEHEKEAVGCSRGKVPTFHGLIEKGDQILDFEYMLGVVNRWQGLGNKRDCRLTQRVPELIHLF